MFCVLGASANSQSVKPFYSHFAFSRVLLPLSGDYASYVNYLCSLIQFKQLKACVPLYSQGLPRKTLVDEERQLPSSFF